MKKNCYVICKIVFLIFLFFMSFESCKKKKERVITLDISLINSWNNDTYNKYNSCSLTNDTNELNKLLLFNLKQSRNLFFNSNVFLKELSLQRSNYFIVKESIYESSNNYRVIIFANLFSFIYYKVESIYGGERVIVKAMDYERLMELDEIINYNMYYKNMYKYDCDKMYYGDSDFKPFEGIMNAYSVFTIKNDTIDSFVLKYLNYTIR